jgi:lipopolysaccharide transport system ATP-binding protein
MSDDLTIQAVGLGKYYRIKKRGQTSIKDSLNSMVFRWLSALIPGIGAPVMNDPFKPYWALRDVSFEIKRGEVVGIIGQNGAGKSTLLKILARITTPTTGYAVLHGSVGAMLEIGSGFHPELTGRENVYMNGSILGIRQDEIANQFDEIVEFAGIGEFIDVPVKYYSSGMYVRLAFSVAAQLNADIHLVDEVFAVGDLGFLEKSRKKIAAIAATGRTVVIVSHMVDVIAEFSTSMMWLEKGSVVMQGESHEVVSEYKKFLELG